jgi:hypothetical protein
MVARSSILLILILAGSWGSVALAGTDSSTGTEAPAASSGAESTGADESPYEGLVARMGPVTASFRFFGDVGASYDSSIDESQGSKSNFLAGTFDFFTSARLGDHLQMLSEIVAEFDPDTNEVGFELERLWGQYTFSDAFYAKLGREHAPVNHWNRRYHHGRIYWPAVTQPFLARFEDQGGPLPIHASGIELGGTVRTGIGAFGYTGVVSNGRGLDRTEVANVQDRNDSKAWDLGGSYAPAGLSGLLFGVNYRKDSIPANPAVPDSGHADERILSGFGELRMGRWEALTEAATIEHESSTADYKHGSAYLQVNYLFDRWSLYGRVDERHMDRGDPFYVSGNIDLDRWDGLAGVRLNVGEQGAVKLEAGGGRAELRDSAGVVSKDDVYFGALALQWVF